MKHKLFLAVLIFSFSIGPNLVSGEIYQWVDKNGVQHFTDGPPPPGAERVEGLSETAPNEPQSKTGSAKGENPGDVQRSGNDPTEREDDGSAEGDENRSTYRDDYWRRKGWGNSTTEAEGPGPAEQGENPPPDQERTDAIGGDNNTPTERKID